MTCGRCEPRAVADVIRRRLQLQRIAADDLHHAPLVVDVLLLRRMRLDVSLDLVACQAARVQIAPGRHRLRSNERFVLFDLIVTAAVDPQVTPQRDFTLACLPHQRLVDRDVLGAVLTPVDVLQRAPGAAEDQEERTWRRARRGRRRESWREIVVYVWSTVAWHRFVSRGLPRR